MIQAKSLPLHLFWHLYSK